MVKRSLTLMEIMIVITLIALTLGATALHIPKAFKKEAFEQDIEQLKAKIAFAEQIMLNYQTDVTLKFESNDRNELYCILKTNALLPKRLEKEFQRHQPFKEIQTITFNEQPVTPLCLYFDGSLGAPPKGKLSIKGQDKEAILTLKGFPSSILRGDHEIVESEASYPKALFSFS